VADGWLHLFQDAVLVGVAALMLAMGAFVLLNGVADFLGAITVLVDGRGKVTVEAHEGLAVINVAENALLALILAELVGSLLLSIRGRPLMLEPFLVIAVVAVVRHLLFLTVDVVGDRTVHTMELLGQGALILILVVAVVLLRLVRARTERHHAAARPAPGRARH
jgi:uncharacterized membrane protein (DUF373 family)